jgi:hypothetical protein
VRAVATDRFLSRRRGHAADYDGKHCPGQECTRESAAWSD